MTDLYGEALYVEDVSVGDEGPEIVSDPLERPDFVKYAGASGDFNPIHYSEPFATGAGHPSVFAQGMFTAGFLSHLVHDWVGRENVDSFRTRFTAQVWPEDVITARGEITAVDEGTGEVEADVWVVNDEGEKVIDGSMSATLPGRG